MKRETFLNHFDLKTDDLSDYLLPTAVSETKQIINGKVFGSTFLIGSVCFLMVVIGLFGIKNQLSSGPIGFMFLSGILTFGLIIVIPSMLFQNMATERVNGSFELLSITPITPNKIILGKWQSGLLQSLVFLSIIFPGIIYCYFFNGISITSIFISFLLTVFGSQFIILLSIFLCSLGINKMVRLLLQLISVLCSIFLFFFIMRFNYIILFREYFFTRTSTYDYIILTTLYVIFFITIEWFFFVVCSARISPFTANKSTWPRIVYMVIVFELIIFMILCKIFKEYIDPEFFITFLISNFVITFFFLMENDELPLVLHRKLEMKVNPVIHFIKRFFYPGRSSAFMLFSFLYVFIMFGCVFYYWDDNWHGGLNSVNMISIVNCFIFYTTLIYLFFCILRRFYQITNMIHYIFLGAMVFFIVFLLPAAIGAFSPELEEYFSVMNLMKYDSYSYEWHLILLNCTITGITLLIALTVAIIKDNRKIATTRSFHAIERGED